MKNQPLIVERTLNAPVSIIWKAFTDKEEMKKWYFDVDAFKPEIGFVFHFNGTSKENVTYRHECKITEIIINKKIAFTWRYEGYEGNSLVTIELFAAGKMTTLRLTHEDLETFPASNKDFAKENFNEGWNHIIGVSLPKYLEELLASSY